MATVVKEGEMKRIMVLMSVLLFAIAGWSQVTTIEFVTQDGKLVPVYEMTVQVTGGSEQTMLQPVFMAPVAVEILNGWHRFQVGRYRDLSTEFDVVADGTQQKWFLRGVRGGLENVAAWAGGIGIFAAVFGGIYVFSSDQPVPVLSYVGLGGGVVLGVGALFLHRAAMPTATRIQ